MPLDPLADDFGGRVNELTADDLSSEEKDATEPAADCDEPVDQPREPDSKNTGPPTDSGHRQQQILFSDATTAPTHPGPTWA